MTLLIVVTPKNSSDAETRRLSRKKVKMGPAFQIGRKIKKNVRI